MIQRLLICAVATVLSVPAWCTGQLDKLNNYDVTWKSPGRGSADSMPLGNGDIGANVWTEQDGDLVFYISKTDSWGDNSRLLKVGRVRIEIDGFNAQRIDGFAQTLQLHDATVSVRYNEHLKMSVWIDANHPVIHVAWDCDEPIKVGASMELWRTEPCELPSIEVSDIYLDRNSPEGRRAATIVEADTILQNQNSRIGWYHHNRKSVGPEITMKVQGLSEYSMTDPILNRIFGAVITADGAQRRDDFTVVSGRRKSGQFDVYVLTAHPSSPDEWLTAMDKVIQKVSAIPFETRLAAHKKWWADFWNRSWIYVTQDKPSAQTVIQANGHPVRVGVDQQGQNRFEGEMGRVSIFARASSQAEITVQSQIDRGQSGPKRTDVLYTAIGGHPETLPDSSGWDLRQGLTVEAWVKPAKMGGGGGRIVDKVTPGIDDGFLLDTYPGNSLRFITDKGTLSQNDVLEPDKWSHVAAVAGTDGLALYLDGHLIAQQTLQSGSDAFVVTRGYILQRYINACAGRGAYPIKFNGSIFTVDSPDAPGGADYRRWGPGYWWQNTRLPYISMCASGDFDLMKPLFDMYAGPVFEVSKHRTRRYFGHGGAYYPECIYFWGAVFSETYGWTPFEQRTDKLQESGWHKWEWVSGLEFVWMMLDYYEHTLDEVFLRTTVLPVADEVLAFFDNHYKTGADGKLLMHPSQALETWWECTNPMPELAGCHAVTNRLIDLPERLTSPEQRDYWRAIRTGLPDLPTREVDGITMLAPAEKSESKRNIENPELYAVFPFRLIGLGKPDIELGTQALHHRWDKGSSGWRQDDVFMAYMGLADEARDNLVARARHSHSGSRFPAFWGPNYDWVPDQDHGGILLKTLQSMVMQTDGRKIFLLPAWPKEWNVDFKLHALYNTAVYGVVRDGKLESLKVTPAQRKQDVVLPKPQ